MCSSLSTALRGYALSFLLIPGEGGSEEVVYKNLPAPAEIYQHSAWWLVFKVSKPASDPCRRQAQT